MDLSVMFMDCPEFADRHGTARCGLPAAVEYRILATARDSAGSAPAPDLPMAWVYEKDYLGLEPAAAAATAGWAIKTLAGATPVRSPGRGSGRAAARPD